MLTNYLMRARGADKFNTIPQSFLLELLDHKLEILLLKVTESMMRLKFRKDLHCIDFIN